MEYLDYKRNEMINELNHQNIKLVEIWHPSDPVNKFYYETGDFRQADKEIEFHEIKRCKDITGIVNEKSSQFINTPDFMRSVITEIENSKKPSITKRFHKDFVYVWHI